MDHGTKLKSISFDLCSHISKQLVSSVVSMYFSFPSLSNFIRARPCSRHVFAREPNNRGIMARERKNSRRNMKGVDNHTLLEDRGHGGLK